MSWFQRLAPLTAGLLLCPGATMAEAPASPVTHRYHGLRPDDPHGRDGLRNPERGWRIETVFAEPIGARVWGPAHHLKGKVSRGYNDDWWVRDALHYERDGLTLAQTYCYLDGYADRPLDDAKLACLQRSLNELRRHGLKAVLRFAYEKDMPGTGGPKLDTILRHIDQLAPLIARNVDVIFVMQAGFVGAWGEWHSSTHRLEADHANLAAIVERVLAVLPPERMTQVRVPKYKRWVLDDPRFGGYRPVDAQSAFRGSPTARIGFNNDGFLAGPTCGGTWPEAPRFSNPGNPEFDQMTAESAYVPVDGELFWSNQAGAVAGLKAAARLRLHHYSSFSIAHSFSDREGQHYSIDDWKERPLTAAQVREQELPLSDGYFTNAAGAAVTRTPFEYIRDHLGYRLELQTATFASEVDRGQPLAVAIDLVNRGFATFINPRPVVLVLIAEDGRVVECPVATADPRRWQPYWPGGGGSAPLTHRISGAATTAAELPVGRYRLGLWLPDGTESLRYDARYAVRVANRDAPWWTDGAGRYGVNVLGEVAVR